MTENEYITLANRVKISNAFSILKNVIPDDTISEDEKIAVMRQLDGWVERLSQKTKITE